MNRRKASAPDSRCVRRRTIRSFAIGGAVLALYIAPANARAHADDDRATAAASSAPAASDAGPRSIFATAIASAQLRTAKVYGAAVGRDKGYGSAAVVSADGKVVTALTALLEGGRLRVVFADGRRAEARVVARDERRQLALLQTELGETGEVPYFEFAGADDVHIGDWIVAATNCFKIAEGDEPVTTAVGVISGKAPLSARRRTRDLTYEGPVLFTDVVVSSPGSAGGALVDLRGRLVGLIGRPVVSNFTNTWANYAIPADDVAAFLKSGAAKLAGGSTPNATAAATAPTEAQSSAHDSGATEQDPRTARPDLGIQLFSVGGRTKPAYVERVRKDSPAAQAGVRANDLILSINARPVATCEQYDTLFATLHPGESAELTLKRGEQILTLKLTVGSRK